MKYVICGRDGSGKSRLAYEMEKKGFNVLKTYTTRKPRHEKEKSYNFISKDEVEQYDDRCLEMTYNDQVYFARKSDIEAADAMVVDPLGVMEVVQLFPDVSFHIVWVSAANDDVRKQKAMNRSNNSDDPDQEKKAMEKRATDPRFDNFEQILHMPTAIAPNATCVHFIENDFNKNTMRDVARALELQARYFRNVRTITKELMDKDLVTQEDGLVICNDKDGEHMTLPLEVATDITISDEAMFNKIISTWLVHTNLN